MSKSGLANNFLSPQITNPQIASQKISLVCNFDNHKSANFSS